LLVKDSASKSSSWFKYLKKGFIYKKLLKLYSSFSLNKFQFAFLILNLDIELRILGELLKAKVNRTSKWLEPKSGKTC